MNRYYVGTMNKNGNWNASAATGHDTLEAAKTKAENVLRSGNSETEVVIMTPMFRAKYERTPVIVEPVSFIEPLHNAEQVSEKQNGMRHPVHGAHERLGSDDFVNMA